MRINQQISDDVKNVFVGISSPKPRLVHKGMVLPRNKIIEELKKMNARIAEKVIFIEEGLPLECPHLERPLGGIEAQGSEGGEIRVKGFNPNEIAKDVYTDEDSFLYYSDGFDKSWRVFIDGKEGKVYRLI